MYTQEEASLRMLSLTQEALESFTPVESPEGKDLYTLVAAWGFDVLEHEVTPRQRQVAKDATFVARYSTTTELRAMIHAHQTADLREDFGFKFPELGAFWEKLRGKTDLKAAEQPNPKKRYSQKMQTRALTDVQVYFQKLLPEFEWGVLDETEVAKLSTLDSTQPLLRGEKGTFSMYLSAEGKLYLTFFFKYQKFSEVQLFENFDMDKAPQDVAQAVVTWLQQSYII